MIMKYAITNIGVLMAVLVVVSVGATYAVTQGIVGHPNGPVGAFMTGNVQITQFDGEGNIIAFRQTGNHIVDTGMDLIIRQVFADVNATTVGWDVPPAGLKGVVRYMEIGTGGEIKLLHNDTDIAFAIVGCARQDAAFINVSSHRSPNSSGMSDDCIVTDPNGDLCRARINVTATASFSGMVCSGALDIDEAGIFNDPLTGMGEMFARNTFGGVVLNPPDTLALDWEFTFTDS